MFADLMVLVGLEGETNVFAQSISPQQTKL